MTPTTARLLNCMLTQGRSTLTPGEARELLGESGHSIALNRGWLQPDIETGRLHIAPRGHARGQMADAALMEDDANDAAIGDEVVVADAGTPYTATVAAKNPDGSVRLSFKSGQKPAKDTFKKTDLRIARKAKTSTTPLAVA